MHLKQHATENFRNLSALSFTPSSGINVISGDNGHGKTNLLESIFLMTGSRSFRNSRDISLIKKDCDFSALQSSFEGGGREQQIKIRIVPSGRTASINGMDYASASAISGAFCCVVFSPEHLVLVKGPPVHRRQFIDTVLCQISPSYLHNIRNCNRLVIQRNSLLKQAGTIAAASEMLEVYNEQYLSLAWSVSRLRSRFCEKLCLTAKDYYNVLSDFKEQLYLHYESTLFEEDLPEDQQREAARLRLIKSQAEEIKLGYTIIGPHRDDLNVSLSGASSKLYASQGQQRCIALSMKLAEADLIEQSIGERPVMLLDDVLSELDGKRQDCLINGMQKGQSIITSCTPQLIAGRADAQVFTLENGRWKV